MITLNREKGIQHLESWTDILETPGFTRLLDPKTATLKEVIGSYTFREMIPCGLSTCQQPHANGFLVVTTEGRVTNLGRVCGKRHFSVDFTQQSRILLAAIRAQTNREFLSALKNRLPAIQEELTSLRRDQYGATWINSRVNQLLGRTGSLPMPVVSAVREAARRGDGVLVVQRLATREERDATDVKGLEHRQRSSRYVEERIGQLEGFAALAPARSLKPLFDSIEAVIEALSSTTLEDAPDKLLRTLSKMGGELDPNLDRLRAAVAAGKKLLVRENICQLYELLTKRQDIRTFDQFCRDLPTV